MEKIYAIFSHKFLSILEPKTKERSTIEKTTTKALKLTTMVNMYTLLD